MGMHNFVDYVRLFSMICWLFIIHLLSYFILFHFLLWLCHIFSGYLSCNSVQFLCSVLNVMWLLLQMHCTVIVLLFAGL